jgi:hypothetical protein
MKCPNLLTEKLILLHDNENIHIACHNTTPELLLGIYLACPPYTENLAVSKFHLFGPWKHFKCTHF